MFSKSILTFLISMTPVFELRAGIPFGIQQGLSWQSALVLALAGNILAAFLALILVDPVAKFLRKKFVIFERFFSWLFKRTHKRHSKTFEIWGSVALAIFVAIPLPGTGGAWTGAVAAYVFGVKKKEALISIAIGVFIAGIIMTIGWMALIRL